MLVVVCLFSLMVNQSLGNDETKVFLTGPDGYDCGGGIGGIAMIIPGLWNWKCWEWCKYYKGCWALQQTCVDGKCVCGDCLFQQFGLLTVS